MFEMASNGYIPEIALPTPQGSKAKGGSYNNATSDEWQSEYAPYPSEDYSDRLKNLIRVRWEGIWEEVRNRAGEKEN